MGVCLSKKKKKPHSPASETTPSPTHHPPAPSRAPPHPLAAAVSTTLAIEEEHLPAQETTDLAPAQKIETHHQRKVSSTEETTASAARERKPVFLVTPAKQRRPSRPPSPDPHSDDQKREGSLRQDTAQPQAQQLSQSSVGGGTLPSADVQLARRRDGGLLPDDPAGAARVVRTSNCTKEEVESILIQCGRLSRSESGKTGESGRRYSGLKRSYDFDKDAGGEEVPAAALQSSSSSARPSPRRRANSREREGGEGSAAKRSNSRERLAGGSGSRRVSRSPGRRSDNGVQQPAVGSGSSGTSSTSNNNNNNNSACSAVAAAGQPGKMVSVPAREKDVGFVAPARRGSSSATIRNSSPRRSRSPATLRPVSVSNENSGVAAHHTQHPQTVSRSSSRKGATEHSPFRRNPMAELDDNVLRGAADQTTLNPSQKVARTPRKTAASSSLSQHQTQLSGEAPLQHKPHSEANPASTAARQQLPISKTAEEEQARREAEEALAAAAASSVASRGPTQLTRTRSSRRSSRDLDAQLLNTDAVGNSNNNAGGASYASLLLEDIHSYHQTQNQHQLQQQAAAAGVTLPPCVSKACSILEAVAGLNSNNSPAGSWNESNTNNHNYSNRRGAAAVGFSATRKDGGGFLESEVAGRDDLMEPSMHRYVSVRDKLSELEPQESAGSNSFIPAHTWAAGTGSSSGGGGGLGESVESSDRCWTSERSGDAGEEVDGCGVEDRAAQPSGNNQRSQPTVSVIRKTQKAGGSLLSHGGGSGTQAAAGQQLARRVGGLSSGGIGRFGKATTSSVIVVPATSS